MKSKAMDFLSVVFFYVKNLVKRQKMINVAIFDPDGTAERQLSECVFISNSMNINFIRNKNVSALYETLSLTPIDIMFVSDVKSQIEAYDFISFLHIHYPNTQIIYLSKSTDLRNVRKAYSFGVKDYLSIPLLHTEIEDSVNNILLNRTDFYFSEKTQAKLDALLKYIFRGGISDLKSYVSDIVDSVFQEFSSAKFDCQISVEKLKSAAYQIMIAKKPWLERYLHRDFFIKQKFFEVHSKSSVIDELYAQFLELGWLFMKYNIIDDNPITYAAGKFLICHIDEKLNLNIVSENIGLNSCYISHVFKKETGVAFQNFLEDVKIERAKTLLKNKENSVKAVSIILNFGSTEYFSKIFCSYTGISPSKYQQDYLNPAGTDRIKRLYLHKFKQKTSLDF